MISGRELKRYRGYFFRVSYVYPRSIHSCSTTHSYDTLVIKLVHHRRRESRESCLLLAAQSRRAVNTGPLAPVRILFAPGLDGLCHANQRRVSVNDVGFSITTHTVLCCLELRVYGVTQNLLPPACSSWSPHLKCKLKAPLVKQDPWMHD